MYNFEVKRAEPIVLVDLIDFEPMAIVTKQIFKKTTVNMSLVAINAGYELKEKNLPFDRVLQVIDGGADIVIDGKLLPLNSGQSIIVPPHTSYQVKANEPVKILLTVLKSGYEI